MVFVEKWPFFHLFFFRHYRPGKYLLQYSKNEITPFQAIKTRSRKCREINPWFWSENGHFSKIFFLGTIGQENVFYDILERKKTFLGYKNKKFKKSKN